jgi:WD40 repeat protein
MLAVLAYDYRVKVWDWPSGKIVKSFQLPLNSRDSIEGSEIAFSPDSKVIACAHGANVVLWDLDSGKERFSLVGQNTGQRRSCSFAFHPGGRLLATASEEEGTIRLWDTVTGREVRLLRHKSPTAIGYSAITFSPDGKTLAAGVSVGQIELCRVPESAR